MPEIFAITTLLNARNESSSLRGLSTLSVVKSRDCASTTGCFILARWMTLKSNYDMRRRQRVSRLVEWARFSIRFSASWSFQIEKCWPSMYGQRSNTDLTLAKHFRCLVSCRLSVSVSDRDWNRMGFIVSSGCFWSKMQPNCTLHAPVSSVIFPPE